MESKFLGERIESECQEDKADGRWRSSVLWNMAEECDAKLMFHCVEKRIIFYAFIYCIFSSCWQTMLVVKSVTQLYDTTMQVIEMMITIITAE